MGQESSQKFLGRNRKPRVHIEYEVDIGGAQKKVTLPFVMGVMADLSGKADAPDEVPEEHRTARGDMEDRKFLDIESEHFDGLMKTMKPHVVFQVKNALTGEGEIPIDLTFESMKDFSPAAVARKVEALNELLQARKALDNLQSYMEGKRDAKGLMDKLVHDKALLQHIVEAAQKPAGEPTKAAKEE